MSQAVDNLLGPIAEISTEDLQGAYAGLHEELLDCGRGFSLFNPF